jgi:branched-chain amino acid aminotransferase
MLSISWSKANGWDAPKIIPHGPLVLDPAAPVFHYGMCCFEGMKVRSNISI